MFAAIGQRLLATRLGPHLEPPARSLGAFLVAPADVALGAAAAALVALALSVATAPPAGPMLVGAKLILIRGGQREQAAAQRRSWELDVSGLLQTALLEVSAGRTLRQSLEHAADQPVQGAARALLDEMALRWQAGSDTPSALAALGAVAPDASSATFFLQLSTAARGGAPLEPVLREEVRRLRAGRRRRLEDELEKLPLHITISRAMVMAAGAAPIAARMSDVIKQLQVF